jgi:hypothetical protein
METKKGRFRVPSLSTISLIALVCFTGFEFIEAWLRHASGTFRHGIFFICALIVVLISLLAFTEKK